MHRLPVHCYCSGLSLSPLTPARLRAILQTHTAKMKFNSVLLFLALTLCVYCTSVLGNDLQLEVQVLGCNNE